MRIYTAHLRPHTTPVLVPEGFSFAALLFGPLWLLAHRAWIAAALLLAAEGVAGLWLGGLAGGWVAAALVLLGGFCGRDLVRWSLGQRGFLLEHVVAGRNEEFAFARLLEARQDLIASVAER